MKISKQHPNEKKRLESLRALNIDYATPNKKFDDITKIAACVCQCPIALVSFIEEDEQYLKSCIGDLPFKSPRSTSFCTYTILQNEPLVINDLTKDQRFSDHPAVTSNPQLRFYASAPIFSPEGLAIGALSVLDYQVHTLDKNQVDLLNALSFQLTGILELDQKIKELNIKEKEARSIIDGVDSIIGHWDVDLKLINCNLSYQEVFGPIESIKGKHARDVLGEELYKKNLPYIEAVLKGSESRFERETLKKDGKLINYFIHFKPNFVDNKVVSFFTLSTDITIVKQSEKIRRELEQKLINSERLSVLGEISCGIAHEINNPLTVINARFSMLKDNLQKNFNLNDDILKNFEKIEKSVEKITKITKGLHTYSRQSSIDPYINEKLINIINDSFNLCEERLKNEQIKFDILCDEKIHLNCRPSQISQVIINLIINAADAIQHLEEKWIKVQVIEDDHGLKILFTDSGRGVPDELKDKIMEPFFTTKEIGKGTGLGLSISKNIIEEHSGKLELDLKAPHTTFEIIFINPR